MRTALRHIGDGIEMGGSWVRSRQGTGRRRAGAHSLRHSAARHWLMVGKIPLNVVSIMVGPCQLSRLLCGSTFPSWVVDYGMDTVP